MIYVLYFSIAMFALIYVPLMAYMIAYASKNGVFKAEKERAEEYNRQELKRSAMYGREGVGSVGPSIRGV